MIAGVYICNWSSLILLIVYLLRLKLYRIVRWTIINSILHKTSTRTLSCHSLYWILLFLPFFIFVAAVGSLTSVKAGSEDV